jgi:hypothetical protein
MLDRRRLDQVAGVVEEERRVLDDDGAGWLPGDLDRVSGESDHTSNVKR